MGRDAPATPPRADVFILSDFPWIYLFIYKFIYQKQQTHIKMPTTRTLKSDFPIRKNTPSKTKTKDAVDKTELSKRSTKKTIENVKEVSEVCASPRRSRRNSEMKEEVEVFTPTRRSRRTDTPSRTQKQNEIKEELSQSPSKRRAPVASSENINPNIMSSPSKKSRDTSQKKVEDKENDTLKPMASKDLNKKNNSQFKSPERNNSQFKSPERNSKHFGLSPPRISPRQRSVTPDKSGSKVKHFGISPPRITPVKSVTPVKNGNHLAHHSPLRLASLNFTSPRKSLNSSPRKSPLKRLLLDCPRMSPLKLNQSPLKLNQSPVRRSPRKEDSSPLKFTSPSFMISKLNLNSPTGRSPGQLLFKPDVSAYRAVKQSLATGTPTTMVGREKQIEEMTTFLKTHIEGGKSGSMYISGAPGTGKTASLTCIVNKMEVRIKQVFVNCMTLRTSNAIYAKVLTELGLPVHSTERDNLKAIEKAITTSKAPVLITLDEIDQLDSKNQEVLYTIFEWPALCGSKLVLVGIANALDLTDRVLPRLLARPSFKPQLLNFPPYTKSEIIKIINKRIEDAGLGDLKIIRPAAVMLLASKISAVAGDVRKALDVCRRAVELCENKARQQSRLKPAFSAENAGSPRKSPRKHVDPPADIKPVEVAQVMAIFNQVYGNKVIAAVTQAPASFPLPQKILVCSLLLMLKHGKSKDITLGKFLEVYSKVCKKRNVPTMDQTDFLNICILLEARGLLQVKKAKEVRQSKISLRINATEAEEALGDKNLLLTIINDRDSLGKLAAKLH